MGRFAKLKPPDPAVDSPSGAIGTVRASTTPMRGVPRVIDLTGTIAPCYVDRLTRPG
jgi:hypothetical protein